MAKTNGIFVQMPLLHFGLKVVKGAQYHKLTIYFNCFSAGASVFSLSVQSPFICYCFWSEIVACQLSLILPWSCIYTTTQEILWV